MGRPQLERHLMLSAEVQRPDHAPSPQVPDMYRMAVLPAVSSSRFKPFSTMLGVPHSLVTATS
jgi:hypothetical protein